MYRRHFRLTERPFQLVPTPAYLYPSRCHQEALGHLAYALASGEGFVEITGEVGTGKTTLLRTFLEGLDETVAVACIFNPTLNAVELLQSINRDFGIAADATSRSDLTASLHRFLISNREAGRKALLVIDEAQNLSIEVLEELRLLSNLETTRTKLLQTILCGQPELGAMLERHELRQLAQRISLACRLHPLSLKETHRYIVHRLKKAAPEGGEALFTKGARALVYRFALGTPRIINICCDRALLCAFVAGRPKVDRRSVAEAVRELSDRPYMAGRPSRKWLVACGGLALVAVTILAVFFVSDRFRFPGVPHRALPLATRIDEPIQPTRPAAFTLADLFDDDGINGSVAWGVGRILGAWGHTVALSELPPIEDPFLLFSAAAASRGMEVMPVDGELNLALAFNLPTLVLFSTGGERPLALVFAGVGAPGLWRFDSSKGTVEISEEDGRRLWTGQAIIACTNPLGFSETVTENSRGQAVIALESALARAGFSMVSVDGVFDEGTRWAVRTLQAAYGLPADGKVGALTRVALASALKNGLPGSEKRVAAHDEQQGGGA